MKGSGPLVVTVLVASTVALTLSSSAGVQHVSFSPTSSNQESQNSASRNHTASEREKFAPWFDLYSILDPLK
ncbi:hypothetical protein ERO13_A07G188200v2 [Gossypium hirsutum]|uniref:Uncharacterized protein n=2 Tax=Gossypium TaxID=3633 RepID=A0A5J5V603_GOSBA|nr:hypothetical protein ES319_A07G204300v1 [Gossypium barbadense]KAG4192928.1 hypothetical protein ERO13_A07G188200v2 [Gossypium hirsutum]